MVRIHSLAFDRSNQKPAQEEGKRDSDTNGIDGILLPKFYSTVRIKKIACPVIRKAKQISATNAHTHTIEEEKGEEEGELYQLCTSMW